MSLAHLEDASADALAPPTNSEIRDQLARIRSSPAFDAPDRAQKFLSYVVEETLEGRADRIKAYSIAIEVFGRDASFDAQNDPVVRIEAGRVRRALERYYLLAGQRDPILITMPKGGYVPVFTLFNQHVSKPWHRPADATPWLKIRTREMTWMTCALVVTLLLALSAFLLNTKDRDEPAGILPGKPEIVVEPFEDLTGTPNSTLVARGLTDEVIGQMARFKEITVIAGRPAEKAGAATSHEAGLPLYQLEGGVRLDNNRLRLNARLVGRADGAVVWANSYDAKLAVGDLLDLEAELARSVATALAQPYGIIFQADAAQMLKAPPGDWQAYACTLSYYGYRADLNPQTHASVQACLKDVVHRFPLHATAWALLSLTYTDELRFRYRLSSSSVPSIDLAREAAQRAVELDPQNVRALQAQMLADFFSGDVQTALAVGERAFAINPNDTELSGEYGFRLALSGQWRRGCDMIADTLRRNAGPMGYFQTALAICSYIENDYETAERWARLADLRDNPTFHLVLIAILAQQGKSAEAAVERNWLQAHAPELIKDIRREVATRIYRPEDQEHLFDGLRKAGLDVRSD